VYRLIHLQDTTSTRVRSHQGNCRRAIRRFLKRIRRKIDFVGDGSVIRESNKDATSQSTWHSIDSFSLLLADRTFRIASQRHAAHSIS